MTQASGGRARPSRVRICCFLLAAALLPAAAARAEEPGSRPPPERRLLEGEALAAAVPGVRLRFAEESDGGPVRPGAPSADGEVPYRRSFVLPAIEVPALVVLINLTDRWVLNKDYAQTQGLDSFWEHLFHGPWEFDSDNIRTNLIAHPYNGSLYYNFARSSGLSFWWSFVYSFVGSLLFEVGGETDPPSIGDQIVTPLGGAFLGEMLYRSSVLILTAEEPPGFWREVAAFLVAPTAGVNRLLFGERYRTREFDEDPGLYFMGLGGAGYFWRTGSDLSDAGVGPGANSEFEFEYGQPASAEFSPGRPFNHFRLNVLLNGDREGLREAVLLEGLLGGWRLDPGTFRGVLGFFGQYDSLSGGLFRLVGVSAGPGVSGQFRLSPKADLQLTLTVSALLQGAVATSAAEDIPYHLGPGERAELVLRLYLGAAARLDLGARQFFVVGNSNFRGSDAVNFVRAAAFLHVGGPHAIGLEATWADRTSLERKAPDIHQRAFTATLNYVWSSRPRFGAAAWEP